MTHESPPHVDKVLDFEESCKEWVKGCSCASVSRPWECVECTRAFYEHVQKLIAAQIPKSCGAELAMGQHWAFCGETDMGQTMPALCTECGGPYKRAEVPIVPHPKFNNVLPEDMPPYCFKRTD